MVHRAIHSVLLDLFRPESRERVIAAQKSGVPPIRYAAVSALAEGADRLIAQLAHAIERAVLICPGQEITHDLFPFQAPAVAMQRLSDGEPVRYRDAENEFALGYFSHLLRLTNGNHSKAALLAGVDRKTMLKRLDKLGLRSMNQRDNH